MKWVFDYRTFWNPGVDAIKVWYGGIKVGEIYVESAARVLQSRLQGEMIQEGAPDPKLGSERPSSSVPSDTPDAPDPDPAATAPAPDAGTPSVLVDPPGNFPELVRVTCEGPLKNAICQVLGYKDQRYRVVVVSDGEYKNTETAVSPENCVPHAAHGA